MNTECDSTVFWRESNRYGVSAWDGLLLVLRIHVTAGRQDLINTLRSIDRIRLAGCTSNPETHNCDYL